MRLVLAGTLAFLAGVTSPCLSQTAGSAPPPTPSTAAVNVFLDCHTRSCDFDYFRREIAAVNWVRDRNDADVQVLVVSEGTGAGGQQVTASFLGLRRFAGTNDSLSFTTEPAAADDDVREQLARAIKIGLVTFIARSSGIAGITVDFTGAPVTDASTPTNDPWNFWVFRIGTDARGDGDKTTKSMSVNLNLSANRVTKNWKTNISTGGTYDDSKYVLADSTTYANIQRNYSVNVLQVKRLGRHISVGLTGGVGSSTYSNQKRIVKVAPAIEYDIFPYSESARRQITFQYAPGIAHYQYQDTTIYLKTQETVPVHTLRAIISARQPWGNLSVNGLLRTQINDFSKRRASIGGNASVRIIRGLSVDFGGNFSSINDQIYLPKDAATDEEILVKQRESATSYRYFARFGFSYTFGSIFNNIVNTRFNSIDFF